MEYKVEVMGIGGWKLLKEYKYLGEAMDTAFVANFFHGERVRVFRIKDSKIVVEYGGKNYD